MYLAGWGTDSKDSEGKQHAEGEDITHHDDDWKSWQLEFLWQKKVKIVKEKLSKGVY